MSRSFFSNISMNMSTMPTIFESAEQTSEYSDELMAALAAGRWWAIMEISDPISEEPEAYGDLISGQCWGRQRAPVTARSTQGASVPARSTQGASVPARSTQGASVPARSTQGASVPARSTQGESVPARSTQGASVPARYTQGAHVPARTTEGASVPARSTEQAPVLARSTQGAPARSKQEASASPSSEKEALTTSKAFTDASEKAQHPGFSDPTPKTSDHRRKWTPKKPQEAPVPAGSHQEPHVPIRSQQRGKLRIPECLIKHLQEASLETAMPAKSLQRAPVAARSTQGAHVAARSTQKAPVPARPIRGAPVPSRPAQGAPVPIGSQQTGQLGISEHITEDLKKSSFGQCSTSMPNKPLRAPLVPMPRKILDSPKHKISEPPRQELLQQKPLAPSPKIEPVCCTTIIDTSSEWKHVTNPDLRSKQLLRQRLQNAPALVPVSSLRIPRQQREKWREMLEQEQKEQNNPKEMSVPSKTPQRTLVSPCSPQQQPGSLQGTPMPSWSTETPAPRQKLCVEFHNYQAPHIANSKLNCLQPRTQLTQKRALDNAGVDQSTLQKKQSMAMEVKDKQSDPGSKDQIDYLCEIFTKCCVISSTCLT